MREGGSHGDGEAEAGVEGGRRSERGDREADVLEAADGDKGRHVCSVPLVLRRPLPRTFWG